MNGFEITADGLERRAREHAGLADFGNPHYRHGLEVLVDSLDRDGPLHGAGRTAMCDLLTLRLSARLKLQDLLNRRPELGRWGANKAPIFVIGTLRSGTTFLYNLMALDPNGRSPQLWETMDPIPPATLSSHEEVQSRISAMDQMLETYNKNLPQLTTIHHLHSPTQVEECSGLLEPTFRSPSIAYLIWGGPMYYEWLVSSRSESIQMAYRDYRAMTAVLMHGHAGKHWLSKCPLYAPYVPEIAEVFPGARFIHAHRDPRERIPSTCSLLQNFQAVYTTRSAESVARQALVYNEQAMKGIERARLGPSGKNTVDVLYEELLNDPVGVIGQVYQRFGMDFTKEHEHSIVDWASNRNPYDPKKLGKHRYTAADFGLCDRELSKLSP